ncbi:MAG TPA: hypothetical protein DIW17_05300 [Clostridiales bacterium]|jgi:HEAT repeat protein|nr:hypothetical protein [Clostridiales bacterium]
MGNSEKRIARLVKRGRWTKIQKMLGKSDSATRAAITTELGNTQEEDAFNILVMLLKDNDEKVQLEAVKSLGVLGVERAKVHLQDMISKIPEDKTELNDAIKNSIAQINEAVRSEAM